MDDQQRARELWSDALRKVGQHEFAYHVGCGGDLDLSEQATLDVITAALRAEPNAAALRVAMQSLEQIASAADDQGAKFNAMGALRFLQTQPVELRAAPEGLIEQHARDSQELRRLCQSRDFYKRRCEALQAVQSSMRDPERKAVCDILANGETAVYAAARPQGVK